MTLHLAFDLLAALSALLMTATVYRWRIAGTGHDPESAITLPYLAALVAGAALGGYAFGTLNLALTGVPGIGRSILGALAGAVAAVELYKRVAGIWRSTGIVFVVAFPTSVAIGRIGCLLSGLHDQTHGIVTGAAWGWDFGDGLLRHPVQLYESVSMAGFLAVALVMLARRAPFFLRNGFYLMVAFYAAQRFIWEFLKPYGTVAWNLNLFHLLCLALVAYGAFMIVNGERRLEPASA